VGSRVKILQVRSLHAGLMVRGGVFCILIIENLQQQNVGK